MGTDLTKVLLEFNLRMMLLKTIQEESQPSTDISERDSIILSLLDTKGAMTVSEITSLAPKGSGSTISTTITKLWKKKLVSKTICPDNQRVTMVDLAEKGRKAMEVLNSQRAKRFQMFFDAINATQEEKDVLLRIFLRGVAFLDKQLKNMPS
ncbi:MAG: hypothetical protein KAS96_07380 [Planctomycetes bacterium]|nr:hypothetical protein [Planctomycetota bacterium]